MVKIILEYADNGVIKTIMDDNINGAGEYSERKKVYEFSSDNFKKTVGFFYDIADDLNINTGNNHSKNTLVMSSDWGPSYSPTEKEIIQKIKRLNLEIQRLENLINND